MIAVAACMAVTVAAQSSAVSISEQDKGKADASLGKNNSVAVFLSKSNNLVITSNNPNDKVGLAVKQANGMYATEVNCDLTAGGGSKRTFTVVIKNTSVQDRQEKTMKPGQRFTFLVEEAKHMLTFWWPETKNVLYQTSAGKACVEFQAPGDLKELTVKFSNNIGGKLLPSKFDKGLNLYFLEVDCNLLKAVLSKRTQALTSLESLRKQQDELRAEIDAKVGQEGFNIEAKEAEEKALEARIEKMEGEIPAVFITLTGKDCNSVSLSEDRIKQLEAPKYKLTVGVNDAMAGEASFDDLLSRAREYYRTFASHGESSFYDAGRTAYDNALNHKDCPAAEKDAIRAESDTLRSLRRNTFLIEKSEAKAREIEAQKGFTDPDVYKYLAGAVRFCDRILTYHPEIKPIEATRARIMARVNQHPSSKKEVTETVTRQRQTITGTVSFKNKYMSMPFNRMKVFASETAKIGMGKTAAIGKVNDDGTFSVVKPDGMDYIYVTGEKDHAHRVTPGVSTMNIEVK